MQLITPFLWFDGDAEAAAEFYVSVFPDSRVVRVVRPVAGGPALVVEFVLRGLTFSALNGGPMYKPSPGISFFVGCEDQAEIDAYWDKLSVGASSARCGWVTDRFGITWQIIPNSLPSLLGDPDREKAQRVRAAMMPMAKLDIAALERARDGA